jgi:signal transduction histidine kinase
MRFKNSTSDTYWWVVLLLAAAVILPTVCLLWFMTAAVRNERLVIRQKLVEIYHRRVNESVIDKTNNAVMQEFDIKMLPILNPSNLSWEALWTHIPFFYHDKFSGFLLYDNQGNRVWPISYSLSDEFGFSPDSKIFHLAWKQEFESNDPNAAMTQYQQIIDSYDDKDIKQTAWMGQLRCLIKTGQFNKAKELCHNLSGQKKTSLSHIMLFLQPMVQLAQLYDKTNDERLTEYLKMCLTSSAGYQYHDTILNRPNLIPTESEIWARQKMIDIAVQAKLEITLSTEIEIAKSLIDIGQLSLETAEVLNDNSIFADWPPQTIRTIPTAQNLYGIYYKIDDNIVLCLITPEKIKILLKEAFTDVISDDMVQMQIIDSSGQDMLEDNPLEIPPEKILLSLPLGRYLPDWKVRLSFRSNDIFEQAIRKQVAIYIWTGILVIFAVIASGSFAIRAVNNQIKLNRIKNNFVATVTHELKTPLSSMRLLVDTLLDGSYTNQQQCKEYLELISHENQRLSRMIDSFLTFSRMERNKQVFDFQPVDPAEIVHAAAYVVLTKMNQPGCHFVASADANLPQIRADKDAMITVLVNLLDNAYKYSGSEKIIELKAYCEEEKVCFAVKDNGIGIPRRIQKKIFDRFYQADNRLSRSTEGCGLGLSIVKFIINAHKGQIHLESKLAQGSKFIVKLPAQQEGRS